MEAAYVSIPYENETNRSHVVVPDTEVNQHYHISRLVQTYSVPFVCTLGLVCNSLATATFLQKGLRKYSCSIYLTARSVSDSMFLLNLAIIYTSSSFHYEINSILGVCKVVVLTSYITGFMSVWLVVLVTFENFIRIAYPFEVKRCCTTRNAGIGILVLLLSSLCVYHFAIWISDDNCAPSTRYMNITQAFIYVDTALTLVIPTILMTVLIIAIIVKITRAREKRESMSLTTANIRLYNTQKRKSESQLASVTKMLLATSLTFLILTVPSHIMRIRLLVHYASETSPSMTEQAIQVIVQILYYFSMAVNLFIYLVFGRNFRRVFRKTFSRNGAKGDYKTDSEKEIRHVTPFSQSYAEVNSGNDEFRNHQNAGTSKCNNV